MCLRDRAFDLWYGHHKNKNTIKEMLHSEHVSLPIGLVLLRFFLLSSVWFWGGSNRVPLLGCLLSKFNTGKFRVVVLVAYQGCLLGCLMATYHSLESVFTYSDWMGSLLQGTEALWGHPKQISAWLCTSKDSVHEPRDVIIAQT